MEGAKKDEPPSDPIIKALGADLGPYQLTICLLIFLSKFPSGWIQLSHVFLAAPIEHKCVEPPTITDACSEDCQKIEYNRSIFKENIITEWDLVCGRTSLASLSQTICMCGIMTGSIVFGTLADKYGRRPMFVFSCLLQLVTGLIVSLSPYFWFYCLFRFLVAFATGGTMVTSFVLIMEIVGKSKREIMAILYQIPFNLGHAFLPFSAYFLRSWRWFNFSYSILSTMYLIYLCVVTESPRWLLSTGRLDRSIEILEKGAKYNKKPTENIRSDIEEASKKMTASAPLKKGTMRDLFRHSNLRMKTIVMCFDWMTICLTYYGTSQYITNLSGNIFSNVAIGACLGVPGTIICVPMTKYLGRRLTLFLSNLLSGVSLLALACLPSISGTGQVVLATLGLFGASVTFPNVYLYGGELFPTVVRNSGIGLCSFLGRSGSMIAPFVSQMSQYGLWIPALLFGAVSMVAAFLTLLLPETRGCTLPETIEDGENFGRKTQ